MDASASPRASADINEVYGLLLTAIDHNNFSTPMNHRSTIIKYTKLPDFDNESKAWPLPNYSIQPRVRRIVTLGDVEVKTNRSLKPDYLNPLNVMTSFTKRKIVTIDEADENDLHPKFTKEKRVTPRTSNRSVGIDFKEEKAQSHRTTSRLTNSSKYSKDIKASTKTGNACKKDVNVPRQMKNKQVNVPAVENNKTRHVKDKEIVRQPKASSVSTRSSISKNLVTPSESEKELLFNKNKLCTSHKSKETFKKTDKINQVYTPPPNKNKIMYIKEMQTKSQPLTVIHVPLDDKYRNQCSESELSSSQQQPLILEPNTTNRSTGTDAVSDFKDVNIGTDPLPKTIDRITDMEDFEINSISKCVESSVQTQCIKETFDSLEIPNVSLTKEKADCNRSNLIPNLDVPTFKITPQKEEFDASEISFCKNASYIISRATLTYTTRQKINFHVVGSNNGVSSSEAASPLAYPMNVLSVFKNELSKKDVNIEDDSDDKKNESNVNTTNCLNELKSLNCSYFFNSNKLMKPSDIISTIRVNNSLLPSDYICEQFQRELNFIDSFFESLQYLESCSLSDKCFADDKVENFSTLHNSTLFNSGFDVKNSEYDNFLSKIENGAIVDDAETMASKSLCLLNLLIRDEQRRAKNLLFVLKMREDALKDFTKSQILWLEKKKKQENTDISTLKKKQRGALLKLQHECGEMQRMRKALLTLSEKRKVALMKTKKNIELKLKNNVDVEQIIFGKKKLKRNTPSDRTVAPLKCFDLSSSGCEESTTSRANSETIPLAPEEPTPPFVTSAEKCVQTGDSVIGSVLIDQSTNTAAENFVVVDGGYLNILFHNLTLPQIFSNGKQYEVNEEALKNIVTSTNNFTNTVNGPNVVEKFMAQINNQELDRSSSPSTARSLVDEFDQYYKGLAETDTTRTPTDSPERKSPDKIREIKDIYVQTADLSVPPNECLPNTLTMPSSNVENSSLNISLDTERSCGCDALVHLENIGQSDQESVTRTSQIQTGPLPVPVGEAAVPDIQIPSIPAWLPPNSSVSSSTESLSSQPLCASASSISSLASPVQCEAEELRRQQIAIEREIKALEQQQCRLLAVREIPDKPPPPYTPPAQPRVPKPPRMFTVDKYAQDKIAKHLTDPEHAHFDPTDPYDVFLKDFCHETLERHKDEQSDKPWDACNLLPQKPPVDNQKLAQETSGELQEILTGAVSTVVSGFSSRRSDHIDDILFTEWRRCEPEWTTLHTDEAIVKNQLFESIFQKILTETIDEYRRTVQCNTVAD